MTKHTISSIEQFNREIVKDKDSKCWIVRKLYDPERKLTLNEHSRRSVVIFNKQNTTWKRLAYLFEHGKFPPPKVQLHPDRKVCKYGKACCNPEHNLLIETGMDFPFAAVKEALGSTTETSDSIIDSTPFEVAPPKEAPKLSEEFKLPDKPIDLGPISRKKGTYY